MVKIFDRNNEVLPKTTVTGWMFFKPAKVLMPGTWKLAVYEVPVVTDDAGRVTKTTKFDLRTVVKKFVDTYRSEGMFSESKLVKSEEAPE